MLKEDLTKMIVEELDVFFDTKLFEEEISNFAQAIVDRLEIDEEKIEKILKKTKKLVKVGKYSIEYWEGGIAKVIAKAKPIKLKESDK